TDLTIPLTYGGTAVPGVDYINGEPNSLTIPAGPDDFTTVVYIYKYIDSNGQAPLVDGDRTVTLGLGPGSGYVVGDQGSDTVTIECPIVTIAATIPTADEATGDAAEFTLTRTGDPLWDMQVYLSISRPAGISEGFTLTGGRFLVGSN